MGENANDISRKYFHKGRVVFPDEDTPSHEKTKQIAHLKYILRLEEYISPKDDLFLDLLRELFEYDHDPSKGASAILSSKVLDASMARASTNDGFEGSAISNSLASMCGVAAPVSVVSELKATASPQAIAKLVQS